MAAQGWNIAPDEKKVERYYAKVALPIRILAKEIDAIARKELPGCTIGMKYGVPFYSLRGPVCYVSCSKKHVNFGILMGAYVEDASGRLEGTKKTEIRKAIFEPDEPLPKAIVRGWLKQARKLDKTWGTH